jgi:hypothetical protein
VHRLSTPIEDPLNATAPDLAEVHIHVEPPESRPRPTWHNGSRRTAWPFSTGSGSACRWRRHRRRVPSWPPRCRWPRKTPVLAAPIRLSCDALVTGDHTHFGALYGRSIQGVAIHSPRSLAEALLRPHSEKP